MVASRSPRAATYADLETLPEHMVVELMAGVLHVNRRPAIRHARAATELAGELGPPFTRGRGGPGGQVLLHEPELHLGADVVVPDLGGVFSAP